MSTREKCPFTLHWPPPSPASETRGLSSSPTPGQGRLPAKALSAPAPSGGTCGGCAEEGAAKTTVAGEHQARGATAATVPACLPWPTRACSWAEPPASEKGQLVGGEGRKQKVKLTQHHDRAIAKHHGEEASRQVFLNFNEKWHFFYVLFMYF